MRPLFTILISAIIAAGIGYGVAKQVVSPNAVNTPKAEAKESTYDRVMRTGTLRCGYALWPPHVLNKDPATGQISGMMPDIIASVAEKLNLKLEWAEAGWGDFIEALRSNRFDAFCAPAWQNAERGKHIDFTTPLFYSPVYLYVRAGDYRFDDNILILNSPDYTFSTLDGEISARVVNKKFPLAKQVSLPQLADLMQLYVNVDKGKADAVFSEPGIVIDYEKKNPGTLRRVSETPYSIYSNSLGFKLGESKFKAMMDSAFIEMLNTGEIEAIIRKYEPDTSVFLPVAKPYEVSP